MWWLYNCLINTYLNCDQYRELPGASLLIRLGGWWSLTLTCFFLFKLVQLDQIREISLVSPHRTRPATDSPRQEIICYIFYLRHKGEVSQLLPPQLSTTTTIISYSTCVGSCLFLSNITFFEVSSGIFYIFHLCLSV